MSSKKEVKITVEENNSRVRKISATIRLENLGQGSDTNNKTARDWMKSLKLGPDYHAGHIVAKQLGGSGSNLDNLVPMHAKFNNGKYKSFESDVKNFLVDGQKYFPIDKMLKLRLRLLCYSNLNRHRQKYLVVSNIVLICCR